ncbi:MAG: hypothetical protein IT355_00700 [Gemmatimonadaceae bacterium]|nr:hypothetical protein [Gemmatimonadaceae bacterium]
MMWRGDSTVWWLPEAVTVLIADDESPFAGECVRTRPTGRRLTGRRLTGRRLTSGRTCRAAIQSALGH